jgi:hypothetical protein
MRRPAAPLPYSAAAMPQPIAHARLGLRCVLWLALGGWIGAMVFFSGVVAPAAFAVLPSPELAGRVVARSLRVLHLGGAGIGVLLSGLAWRLGRSRSLIWLPVLLAGLCLISHFGVSGALAEMRAMAEFETDPALRARFAVLHRVSVAVFALVLLSAMGLLVLHVRADRPKVQVKKTTQIS